MAASQQEEKNKTSSQTAATRSNTRTNSLRRARAHLQSDKSSRRNSIHRRARSRSYPSSRRRKGGKMAAAPLTDATASARGREAARALSKWPPSVGLPRCVGSRKRARNNKKEKKTHRRAAAAHCVLASAKRASRRARPSGDKRASGFCVVPLAARCRRCRRRRRRRRR